MRTTEDGYYLFVGTRSKGTYNARSGYKHAGTPVVDGKVDMGGCVD